MAKQVRITDLIHKKHNGEKITMLTAYDHLTASLIDEAKIDMILVGDSLGNVFAGYKDTLPVTIDQIIYHCKAVTKAATHSLVVGDMPFLSYEISTIEAKKNAGRLIKEGGVQAIKCEVNITQVDTVKAIVDMGIPVVAHIGFTPQSLHQLGGYKIQGKTKEDHEALHALALALEKAGACAIVLEMIPQDLAKTLTQAISIPTIGIGAGPHCDGQVLVTQDLLGLSDKTPSFIKQYATLKTTISQALNAYKSEVEENSFPSKDHSF